MAVMNFRFAHYDPPKEKPKQASSESTKKKKKDVRLQFRLPVVHQKRKTGSTNPIPEVEASSDEVDTLSEPSPPAKDNSVIQKPGTTSRQPLITLIDKRRLDPFQVYPVEQVCPYIEEVLCHAINEKWPNVSPSPTATSALEPSHPVKRGWMQCARSSPVAFYALFYAASQHLNYLQHGVDSSDYAPTLRLAFKTKAIALINKELSNLQGKPLPDALLIAILSLGAHGNKPVTHYNTDTAHNQSPLASAQMLNFYGHIDQETAHMSALRLLLAHNKGVINIQLPGLVGALQLGDILHSTITNQVPTLSPNPSKFTDQLNHFIDPGYTCPIISSSLPKSIYTSTLLETLIQARALTDALEQHTNTSSNTTTNTPPTPSINFDTLIHARNLIHHTLISLPPANGLWDATYALYNCIRLALRIYSDLVFFPLPASTGVRINLARKLRAALDDLSQYESVWKQERGVVLWVCVLAGVASEEVEGLEGVVVREGVRELVRRCAVMCGCRAWEGKRGVEEVCERVLWWKHVCGGRGRGVWEAIVGVEKEQAG